MRTRPAVLLLVAAGTIGTAAAGCGVRDLGRAPAGDRPPCADPARHDLGFVWSVEGPWPSFRSAGGEVYVGVRGLEQDTVLGPVRLTRMSLVEAGQRPRFRAATSVVRNAAVTADVRPGGLTKVRVPAGRYRVVASNGGNLWVETCADALVSDVRVAQPAVAPGR